MSQIMGSDATQDAAELKSAPNIEAPIETHRRGIYLDHVQQSVVGNMIHNEKNINFNTIFGDPKNENVGKATQSIHGNVEIKGHVNFDSRSYINNPSLHSEVIAWLNSLSSTLPFEKKHNENIQIAQKGVGLSGDYTGQWFLKEPDFVNWKDGDLQRLWCYGTPGVGKTILSSIIIHHLQNTLNDGAACIYIYFDHREHKVCRLGYFLSSLLCQLIRRHENIAPKVKDIYERSRKNQANPTTQDYRRMLKSQIGLFSKVFIIVDALDECISELEGNIRDDFLAVLDDLPSKAHILFMSRKGTIPNEDAEKDSKEILATKIDLRIFVRNYIQTHRGLRRMIVRGEEVDKAFHDNIAQEVINKSHGIFLLARLHMDFLASQITLDGFKGALANLPTKLDNFYEKALERIQSGPNSTLAIRILTWLVYTKRPLNSTELIHALSVQNGDICLVTDRFLSKEDLTSACAGVVVIDEIDDGDKKKNIVRLAHFTAEEFLRRKLSSMFKYAASELAETCLTYLSFDVFKSAILKRDMKAVNDEYPFLHYASNHWGNHLSSGVKGEVHHLAWKFLSDSGKLMNALQLMEEECFRSQKCISSLHLCAYFGLHKMVKKLIARQLMAQGLAINTTTHRSQTALHWAAFYSQRDFVELLVESGINLNVQDDEGKTALHMAIMRGDMGSVEILATKTQLDFNLRDLRDWTPLRWAAAHGQLKITELLLNTSDSVDIDAQDEIGLTALRLAAQNRHKGIVDLLIKRNASFEIPSKDGRTLLLWAAAEGQDSLVDHLIKKKAKVNAVDNDQRTALRWATDYGRGMCAWLLLQASANIDLPDKEGMTPLHSAIEIWPSSKDKSLVWLLLENKANIEAQTKLGLTPLHVAAKQGHLSLVWLLLEKKANIHARTKLNLTPLHLAAEGGHTSLIYVFLANGADPNAQASISFNTFRSAIEAGLFPPMEEMPNISGKQEFGLTPLHVAASKGHNDFVGALLARDADLNARDKLHLTALHIAAKEGHSSTIDFLLTQGANLYAIDTRGSTALHYAVMENRKEVVWRLSRHKELLEKRDDEKRTALHIAAASGHISIVELLVTRGAELNVQDRLGCTPLHLAITQPVTEVVTYLMEVGTDIGVVNKKGKTVIEVAEEMGLDLGSYSSEDF